MRFSTLVAACALFLSLPTLHAAQESALYAIPTDSQNAGGGERARSANYMLSDTLGEAAIGPSGSANYDLNAGYRQTLETFLSLAGPASINLGTITGNGQATAEGTWTVITDASAGYSLTWLASSATMISGSDTIGPYTPASANVPETWSVAAADAEWGGRLRSSSTDVAAEWGTDVTSEKWLNVATAQRAIVTRTSRTSVGGSTEIVQFRTEIGASRSQPTGAYSVTVTMTATSL